ncbi:hypothetical protein T492DRAFT_858549 [Pavlovales sp. CCMP2436]|nr:hypothetical protein T492DRAFT_858549 [Pavlovales sp. CCMP2436]
MRALLHPDSLRAAPAGLAASLLLLLRRLIAGRAARTLRSTNVRVLVEWLLEQLPRKRQRHLRRLLLLPPPMLLRLRLRRMWLRRAR